MTSVMLCAHCATPVPKDARYCHACGSLVSDAEGQASASASLDREALLELETRLRAEAGSEFEILRQLGRGGMAVVFLAREHHLARLVAIKVLPPELTFGHGVERFKREARTAAALGHPNIIPIYRIGAGGALFWYTMKYVDGPSLDQVLRDRGRLPVREAIPVLAQVADALAFAHQRNVVHRDVKPANVLLDPHDRVIVTDFGIAKALSTDALTASGSAVGTPYYMSPEQWLGQPVSGATDQYAVAVMAYRMLSGHVPFHGATAVEILQQHCTAPVPPLETLAPDVPSHVCAAIYRALEKEPDARFPSMGEFVDALRRRSVGVPQAGVVSSEAATERMGLPVALPEVQPPKRRPARDPPPAVRAREAAARRLARRRRRNMVLAVLVVAGGAAGLAAAWRGWNELPWPFPTTGGPLAGVAPETTSAPPTDTTTAVVAAAMGVVVVTGLPDGATVEAAGEQRSSVFELTPGRHAVTLRAPGFAPHDTAVDVVAGDTAQVRFTSRLTERPTRPRAASRPPPRVATPPSPSVLRIQVTPPARVLIDGVDLGEQRTLIHTVTGGVRHTLSVVPVRSGYVRKDTTFVVSPGDTVTLRIRLEASP